MSHHERNLTEIQKDWPQTLNLYIIGFFLSILLTGVSFSLVLFKDVLGSLLTYLLIFFALVQAAVQLIFFMHMGKEAKPRWMTTVFGFMVVVILIIVLCTLWIMWDLNHRVMPLMS